jgi:hypothetical protein
MRTKTAAAFAAAEVFAFTFSTRKSSLESPPVKGRTVRTEEDTDEDSLSGGLSSKKDNDEDKDEEEEEDDELVDDRELCRL